MDSNPQSDNDMCLSEQQMKEIYYEARNMKDNHMGQVGVQTEGRGV